MYQSRETERERDISKVDLLFGGRYVVIYRFCVCGGGGGGGD